MKEVKKSGLGFFGGFGGMEGAGKWWRGPALLGQGGTAAVAEVAAVAAVSPSPPLAHPFGQKYYQ